MVSLTPPQAFKKMEPDWWLELENTYSARIAQRKSLYDLHGGDVLQALPGSEAACNELMEMALQFLLARYPQYFSLVRSVEEDSEIFVNRILDRQFVIRKMHPLVLLLENVPEDFAVTLKNHETGMYEFRAGIICSSLGWNVASKIGKNLQEIHQPIPDYKGKMAMSMDRFVSIPLSREATDIRATVTSPRCRPMRPSSAARGDWSIWSHSTCRRTTRTPSSATPSSRP